MFPLTLLAVYLYYIGFDMIFRLREIKADFSDDEVLYKKILRNESSIDAPKHEKRLRLKADFDLFRLSFMPDIERGIKMMGILAAVAPLLGLLGTVSGMGLAISSVGDASGSFAEGVSSALITTQYGLTIAIPAMVICLYCSRLRQKILIRISRFEKRLIMQRCAA